MPNWNEIITKALRELEADTTLTRGAILRSKVNQIASDSEFDFDAYLKDSAQKFSSVVERIDNVVIYKRPNTDMFVGFKGAEWPDSVNGEIREYRKRFRADVYEAFTRISDSAYWYFPDTDQFTQNISGNASRMKIPLPSVTLGDLLNQRREFAEQSETKDELLKALMHSPNPLAAFQSAISRQRLGRAWHNYKSERLEEQIQAWAKENDIQFRPHWIDSSESQENSLSPQQLMAHFATFMTDDEIRAVPVPFRAVEAMYRNISGSNRNLS